MTKENHPIGFTLQKTLEGHSEIINRLEFSPEGNLLASSSFDGSIALWEVTSGHLQHRLQSPSGYPRVVKFSHDGQWLAVGCNDKTVQLWKNYQLEKVLVKHLASVNALVWSPDDQILASGSDDGSVILWDTQNWQVRYLLNGHSRSVNTLEFSPHLNLLISGGDDKLIRLWNPLHGQLQRTLKGHSGMVLSIVCYQTLLVSSAGDKTLRVWDLETGRPLRVLEGHTDVVYKLAFSHDGQLLASKSDDHTVRLWRGDATAPLAILEEPTEPQLWLGGLAFHPHQPWFATLGEHDRSIRLWQLDVQKILAHRLTQENFFSKWFKKICYFKGSKPASSSSETLPTQEFSTTIHYTTAKIALVGDSGVGKTGLGWRIAHGYFKEHPSTHGQQFWVVDDLGTTRQDGTLCEAVLWDLAGQPDYRLIHTLFLEDVDLALVVFDPTHRQEPLKGVEYWISQLRSHHCSLRTCQMILIGARTDRGSPTLTHEELQQFCQRYNISHYLTTSALSGEGVPELMAHIKQTLKWEEMTATVTTLTFRRIKEFVLSLKENSLPSEVLLSPATLRARLEETDPHWQFSDAQLMTALQHLSNHGYVTLLRRSLGEQMVLLLPELLVNVGSSLILEARRNEKGLGALEEDRVLRGDYSFPPEIDRWIAGNHDMLETLIDAVMVLFLEHMVCFRETAHRETFLVFPTLINQKRPALDDIPTTDDMSYTITGAVENVYPALVVLFGYTHSFTRIHHWQNQAQYEMGQNELCGFRKVEEREGELELVLYYSKNAKDSTKLLFRSLFERFLQGREVVMTSYSPVVCSTCNYQQERSEVTKRLKANKSFMFCGECGGKIMLVASDEAEEKVLTQETRETVEYEQSSAFGRTQFAKALVWVKGYLRHRTPKYPQPSCFISYAWGINEHERWVRKFAEDILDAGMDIILDDWDNAIIGSSVPRFISRLETCDFVVVVGTPLFLQKYHNKISSTGSVVAAEVDLIAQRLIRTEKEKSSVLPVLLDGEDNTSLPALLRGRSYADFRDKKFYFARLFDLILTLYRIDFRDPAVRDLREELRVEAQRGR